MCREQNVAMLLVTHDLSAARYADRTHSLHDGHLEAFRPEEWHARASVT
jgi:ABC-type lipoprotein export system ATPase subunit